MISLCFLTNFLVSSDVLSSQDKRRRRSGQQKEPGVRKEAGKDSLTVGSKQQRVASEASGNESDDVVFMGESKAPQQQKGPSAPAFRRSINSKSSTPVGKFERN